MSETINGKANLNRLITKILWEVPEYPFEFPFTVYFKESMTSSKFKFTIEKEKEEFFIDVNGQKWIKAPEDE